jgi:hypothetical protein
VVAEPPAAVVAEPASVVAEPAAAVVAEPAAVVVSLFLSLPHAASRIAPAAQSPSTAFDLI